MKDSAHNLHISTFDLERLDSRLLYDEVALELAVGSLEGEFLDPAIDSERLILDLLVKPGRFETVYSYFGDSVVEMLENIILKGFPLTAQEFEGSLARRLILRLTESLGSLSHPTARLVDFGNICSDAQKALSELSHLRFDDDISHVGQFSQKRHGRKGGNQSRHSGRGPVFGSELLKYVRNELPTADSDVFKIATTILTQQKDILKRYLQALRDPELGSMLREAYLTTGLGGQQFAQGPRPVSSTSALEPASLMAATLDFENADGFGEWKIFISNRAERDIRKARKKDMLLLKIIVRRLRELSNGAFTDGNYRRLNGDDGVPIFKARLNPDKRLIYQIHCIHDYEAQEDMQVIRVFGIYNHAQLGNRFWDAVGQHLKGHGDGYRQRCLHRQMSKADGTIPPTRFGTSGTTSIPTIDTHSDLQKAHGEELNSLILLEKFVVLSQALLNTILADQDVAHTPVPHDAEQAIIRHTGSCYVIGRSGTGKTTTIIFKMLGIEKTWALNKRQFEAVIPRPRQLFVTQSEFLVQKVKESYTEFSQSEMASKFTAKEAYQLSQLQSEAVGGLYNRDEEAHRLSVLPQKYSQLTDRHFPLFLSFDNLCRLLEADISTATGGGAVRKLRHSWPLVNYDEFLGSYWRHFPAHLTKDEDPALVYAEFIGVIEGSEQSLGFESGYLDRDTYMNLSDRAFSTFSDRRGLLYDLFEVYQRLRARLNHYDPAERSHRILRGLAEYGVIGDRVDYLYVDETQDNLLVDIKILRAVCRNSKGFFWAGDTAQTIAAGSSFRFDDLKSFLYRLEMSSGGRLTYEHPELFSLAINLRSHGGIVSCAQSVVELITRFWPYSIDAIVEERGSESGSKPIFLRTWDVRLMRFEHLLHNDGNTKRLLGADQCILVHDDKSKSRIKEQIGKKVGVVMTIWESKGLEFDDVFLLDFFHDSEISESRWRVLLDGVSQGSAFCPQFDERRHRALCRELKILYVGITRARKNLWIFDSSEKGECMRKIWEAKDQIRTITEISDLPQLARESSTEDWVNRGRTLFNNKNYSQAIFAFERAGRDREKNVAEAYYLRQEAIKQASLSQSSIKSRRFAFEAAGRAFERAGEEAETKEERLIYYHRGAECYERVDSHSYAARAYEFAAEPTSSIKQYRLAEMFSDALPVIDAHRGEIEPTLATSITTIAKLYFLKKRMLREAKDLFSSVEAAIEYMKDVGLEVRCAPYLELCNRYLEAAEFYVKAGRLRKASTLIETYCKKTNEAERAIQCVLKGLWTTVSLGEHGIVLDPIASKLIELGLDLISKRPNDRTRKLLETFQVIQAKDFRQLQTLTVQLNCDEDVSVLVVSLEHLLNGMIVDSAMPLSKLERYLESFLVYMRVLQDLYHTQDNCNLPAIQRLLSFLPTANNFFVIRAGTLFHKMVAERLAQPTETKIEIPGWRLQVLIKEFLSSRIRGRFEAEDRLCRGRIPVFRVCSHYTLFGRCDKVDCRDHIDFQSRPVEFNRRIRANLLQIMICGTIVLSGDHGWTVYEQERYQNYWLQRLYESIHPETPSLGTVSNLNTSAIPTGAVDIVLNWVHKCLSRNKIKPRFDLPHPSFLTDFIKLMHLYVAFSQRSFPDHLHQTLPNQRWVPLSLIKNPQGSSVLEDIVQFFGNNEGALSSGIEFVRHILEKCIPIDISVLCDILDEICCSLVLCRKIKSDKTPHGVVLPQSWIIRCFHQVDRLDIKNIRASETYLPLFERLLVQVFTGIEAGSLLYGIHDLGEVESKDVRSIFLQRMCRNMCFFGLNVPDNDLRLKIHTVLSSLLRHESTAFGRSRSSVYARYVESRDWDKLVEALLWSFSSRNSEEIIQLASNMRGFPPLRFFHGVRRIVFNTLSEIPQKVGCGIIYCCNHSSNLTNSKSTKQATTKILRNAHVNADRRLLSAKETHAMAERIVVSDPNISREMKRSARIILQCYRRYRRRAAHKILHCFRRYIKRKRSHAQEAQHQDEISALRTQCFEEVLSVAGEMQWSTKLPYRVIFLGPLPHILVCIRYLQAHAHREKKSARHKILEADHLELESIHEKLSEASNIIHKTTGLLKDLQPSSDLHKSHNLGALKDGIRALRSLMEGLPNTVVNCLQNDLRLGVKGILLGRQIPPAKPRPPKPTLNMSDDLEYAVAEWLEAEDELSTA